MFTSKFWAKFNPLALRLRTLCPLRSNLWCNRKKIHKKNGKYQNQKWWKENISSNSQACREVHIELLRVCEMLMDFRVLNVNQPHHITMSQEYLLNLQNEDKNRYLTNWYLEEQGYIYKQITPNFQTNA